MMPASRRSPSADSRRWRNVQFSTDMVRQSKLAVGELGSFSAATQSSYPRREPLTLPRSVRFAPKPLGVLPPAAVETRAVQPTRKTSQASGSRSATVGDHPRESMLCLRRYPRPVLSSRGESLVQAPYAASTDVPRGIRSTVPEPGRETPRKSEMASSRGQTGETRFCMAC